MKASFFEYHRPTKEQFAELWASAVFSFDASVLLDLYRFTNDSREELLRLLKTRRERIWLTHQSAYEFHKNRIQVIAEAGKRAAELRTSLTALQKISTDFSQHPFVTAVFCGEIEANCAEVLQKLQEAETNYPNLLSDDPIAIEVLDIFDGLVGKPYEPEKLPDVHAQIAARYDQLTPPGYRDRKNKDEQRSYGDCIMWFQLIAYAKEHKCPVILVTRDLKEDWWLREGGKTLLPRPELRREFRDCTGGYDFYLYQLPNFMEFAKEHTAGGISDRLLEESRVIAAASEVKRAEQRVTAEGEEPLSRKPEIQLTSDGLRRSNLNRLLHEVQAALRARGDVVKIEQTVGKKNQAPENSSEDFATSQPGESGDAQGNT